MPPRPRPSKSRPAPPQFQQRTSARKCGNLSAGPIANPVLSFLVPLPPRSEAVFASLGTQDADLIVARASGHSRIYERLFGGVTRDLMHQKSLPALMLHSSLGEERPLSRPRICGAATLAPSSVAAVRGRTPGSNDASCREHPAVKFATAPAPGRLPPFVP